MEKVIYALWREADVTREDFNAALLGPMKDLLLPRVHALRFNIQDDIVSGGTTPRFASTHPAMEAFVQVWVDSAIDRFREPIDQIVGWTARRYSAWLASESVPIRNTGRIAALGERTPGYSHMAVISIPPRLTWRAWQDRWQNHHTTIAIDTQSNFEYVQNLIVRPLTYAAAGYGAIIEESFPSEAFNDELAFHDAAGDPAKFEKNRASLLESTFTFVDANGFDLIPVSQYDFKRLLT